jgi:hypothetical protein
MPRRDSRGHRLPTGGYREHRLAIWGVTGCVAVAAGVALTAGLAAASPHLGNIPGSTDRRPALAGLPTTHPTAEVDAKAQPMGRGSTARVSPSAASPTPTPCADPSADSGADAKASARPSNRSWPRPTSPWHH